jgi:hypothetical protein
VWWSTALFVVVLLLVATPLILSSFRDRGPQPPVPPSISGTDDGGLKRAIVHYLGAVATGDPTKVVDVMDYDTARGRALAQAGVDDYGDVARKRATVAVRVERDDVNGTDVGFARIDYAGGRTQDVTFTQDENDNSWSPNPTTNRPLPEDPPGPNDPPSASAAE